MQTRTQTRKRSRKRTTYRSKYTKPVALIAHLIRQYTNQGDTVLDAYMGSVTTAVAAIRTGRNWIGYELNKDFFYKGGAQDKGNPGHTDPILITP